VELSIMLAADTLKRLWQLTSLPGSALDHVHLSGADPVLPSSFAVGAAAQSTVAAAALAACEVGYLRGAPRQDVSVDMRHAALEAVGWFSIDGRAPPLFDPLSGLYRCADGWVRLHAVFLHHRQGAMRLLNLDPDKAARSDVEQAIASWHALELEEAAARAGLVLTAMRSFDEWDATSQGAAVGRQPLFSIERIAAAPPKALPSLAGNDTAQPLEEIRILDLTRILAGPVAGRTLAAYGADVMLINGPHLPNIEAIAETSRGKRSAVLDLRKSQERDVLRRLSADAHVFVQGYRPGGLVELGFGPAEIAKASPGIVYVTLSAYGREGPWAARRGFDSLVQTAMGFNKAEGAAAQGEVPRALPMQILDHATGFLIAACVSAALVRQAREGGSWHVNVSLAQTGQWLRSLGQIDGGFEIESPQVAPFLEKSASGFGELNSVRHSAQFSRTPAEWVRPSMPPGSHPPAWTA
jgi:hypothetical protein